MVKKKGKSKRQTLKQKYKIERKVKEHKRKVKKETRRRAKLGLPPVGIGQRKTATTIPNAWPFKEQLLEELAQAKRRMEEEKQQKKEEAALRRKQALLGTDVAELVRKAEARAQAFDEERATKTAAAGGGAQGAGGEAGKEMRHLGQQSRRAFIRDLREVVETADVILEVLDARDPLGSRAEAVEELILRRPNKKLVLVLNKVDLVPKEVIGEWLAYLRRSHPTVAFKSATQEQRSALSQHGGDAAKASANVLSRAGSVGADALMQLLKNYCRSLDIKTSITVGIVGYPNVGKSSLINSLKRCKSVGVSPTPGFTKAMQEVQLDRHIKLLDSPGIVFDDDDVDGVLLRNCVNVDTLPDPATAVTAMLKRCDPADLMMIYALPRFDAGDVNAFLALLARKLGKLLKGGVPDRNAAARVLLRDWNTGKVPFYTKPPSMEEQQQAQGAAAVAGEAMLVGQLGEEFALLKEGDAKVMDFLQAQQPEQGFVAFDAGGGRGAAGRRAARMLEADGEEEEDDESEDEEEEEEMDMDCEEEEDDESDEDEEAAAAPARGSRARGRGASAAATASSRAAATAAAMAVAAPAQAKGKAAAGKAKKPQKSAVEVEEEIEAAANQRVGLRKRAKEAQKKARKVSRRAAAAMDEGGHSGDEGDYDFMTDFRHR